MKMPPDPITPAHEMAATLHEFCENMEGAGFARDEAVYLTGQWMAALTLCSLNGEAS